MYGAFEGVVLGKDFGVSFNAKRQTLGRSLLVIGLKKTINNIQSFGNRALVVAGNISKPSVAAKIVKMVVKEYRRINILVDNPDIRLTKIW
jgi:hypothetical protein